MSEFEPLSSADEPGQIDLIDLFFGGMTKLGPGDDDQTRQVLGMLPTRQFQRVCDVGCGTGRQTLVLARELGALIHAVDLYRPFLDDLLRRARTSGCENFVQVHQLDMRELASHFHDIDLLWSEGAAYNLGFARAIAAWAQAIKPGGFAVISECSWLSEAPPAEARAFWKSAYPSMASVAENQRSAEMAGFRNLGTHLLPSKGWVDGYYEVLQARASKLIESPEPLVRNLATDTLREISLFRTAGESYGYVFYLLDRL